MKKDIKKTIKTELSFLPIGAIAQSLGVHQRTLRIYDKEGILSPKRTEGNRRYYSLDDFEKAKAIQFLTKNLALNLSGVKLILAFLEKLKIKPEDYIEYIEKIAKSANINLEMQKLNIEKTSKRGRPKANQDKI
ncbi:MAG: MerR family transcriptional regulator [Candidatus Gastranaerophilales bacterium]|nr:MerR family transcriptional regulator [Candidatus Gastranaerophilales bacterium]